MSDDNDWEQLNMDNLHIANASANVVSSPDNRKSILENEYVSNAVAVLANLTEAMMDVIKLPSEHGNIIRIESYLLKFARSPEPTLDVPQIYNINQNQRNLFKLISERFGIVSANYSSVGEVMMSLYKTNYTSIPAYLLADILNPSAAGKSGYNVNSAGMPHPQYTLRTPPLPTAAINITNLAVQPPPAVAAPTIIRPKLMTRNSKPTSAGNSAQNPNIKISPSTSSAGLNDTLQDDNVESRYAAARARIFGSTSADPTSATGTGAASSATATPPSAGTPNPTLNPRNDLGQHSSTPPLYQDSRSSSNSNSMKKTHSSEQLNPTGATASPKRAGNPPAPGQHNSREEVGYQKREKKVVNVSEEWKVRAGDGGDNRRALVRNRQVEKSDPDFTRQSGLAPVYGTTSYTNNAYYPPPNNTNPSPSGGYYSSATPYSLAGGYSNTTSVSSHTMSSNMNYSNTASNANYGHHTQSQSQQYDPYANPSMGSGEYDVTQYGYTADTTQFPSLGMNTSAPGNQGPDPRSQGMNYAAMGRNPGY